MSEASSAKRLARLHADLSGIADPVARLGSVREARETLEAYERETVAECRARGVTWSAIGALYGLTKQGAQQRFQLPRKGVRDAG